jgi:hypothetical protein
MFLKGMMLKVQWFSNLKLRARTRSTIPFLSRKWLFLPRVILKLVDSVDHDILLAKLKTYGVNGNLLNWFTDYLHGRVQRVVVDGVASDWATVTSGVPQGSLLGPILFVIFINDFPNVVSDASQTALYADDSKLYKSISCLGSCESLQQSLNHLSMWSHNNNISFNASKCKVLTVTRKSSPLCFDYHLGNTTLVHVRKEKDLGCIITNHLTWDQQVLVVVCKANKMLGLLRRTCPLLTNTKCSRLIDFVPVLCERDLIKSFKSWPNSQYSFVVHPSQDLSLNYAWVAWIDIIPQIMIF